MKKDINWKDKALEIVKEVAGLALDNEDKIDKAIDMFIPWADKALAFKNPIIEGLSDWVLRKPLRPLIKAFLEFAHEYEKGKNKDDSE